MNDDAPDTLDELVAAVDAEVAVAAGVPAGRSEEETPDSAEPTAGRDAGRYGRYLLFSQGQARYAVPITQVLEVASVPALTPVPHTPAWLLGVTNLRGEILSVIDLGAFLGGEGGESGGGRMLVVRGDNDEPYTGVVVDAVLGQTTFATSTVSQPAAPIEDPVMSFLDGVVEARGEAVGVLDLKRVAVAAELAEA